jgi:hypothetical protein
MRTILVSALLLSVSFSSAGRAAEPAVTTAQVEAAIGSDLPTAIAKFGVPKELGSWRSTREGAERFQHYNDDCVQFGYGSFGLLVQRSSVLGCVFLPDWKETVRGVKPGDSRDDVVKVLGNPFREGAKQDFKANVGTKVGDPYPFSSWEISEGRQLLCVYWSKDTKAERIEVWSRPPSSPAGGLKPPS